MAVPHAGQAPQGPTLVDAAKVMEGLLDLPETIEDQPEVAAQEAPADTDEGVAAEAKPEETTADEAEVGEAEATETDESAAGADDKDRQVTVTIDGKAETIPLHEALQGYQRYSDYTRKTQELSAERQTITAQKTAIQEERQTYAVMLKALHEQLQGSQPEEPNWDEVYRSDPVGYARRRDEWRDKQDKIAAANFELSRLHTLQQQQNAEQLAQVVQQGRQKMVEMQPAWKDQTVWENDRQALVKYAKTVGYSTEEISQAYDPRAIVMMDKARRYDELMANKPKPDAVKGPRVAAAGPAPQAGVTAKLNSAQQRLAKSGRVTDAAKVFEQLI
jgi:hypothetical protein